MNEDEQARFQELATKVATLETQMASMFHLYEKLLAKVAEADRAAVLGVPF